MELTKILENIPGLNPEEKVVIKKLGYGDRSRLMGKIMKINVEGRKQSIDMDMGEYRLSLLVIGIQSAPFFDGKFDKKAIVDALQAETGEFLFREISDFNNLGDITELSKKSD